MEPFDVKQNNRGEILFRIPFASYLNAREWKKIVRKILLNYYTVVMNHKVKNKLFILRPVYLVHYGCIAHIWCDINVHTFYTFSLEEHFSGYTYIEDKFELNYRRYDKKIVCDSSNMGERCHCDILFYMSCVISLFSPGVCSSYVHTTSVMYFELTKITHRP